MNNKSTIGLNSNPSNPMNINKTINNPFDITENYFKSQENDNEITKLILNVLIVFKTITSFYFHYKY